MTITHAYHIYADGDWVAPFDAHIEALRSSGLMDSISQLILGVSGTQSSQDAVDRHLNAIDLPEHEVVGSSDGWEQSTINAFRRHLQSGVGLYAHTKGAANNTHFNALWRMAMTRIVISDWKYAIEALSEWDSAGPFLTTSQSTEHGGLEFYAGNFFWITAEAAKRIPAPAITSRYDAEVWVSDPSITRFDMYPGFPSLDLFLEVLSH